MTEALDEAHKLENLIKQSISTGDWSGVANEMNSYKNSHSDKQLKIAVEIAETDLRNSGFPGVSVSEENNEVVAVTGSVFAGKRNVAATGVVKSGDHYIPGTKVTHT